MSQSGAPGALKREKQTRKGLKWIKDHILKPVVDKLLPTVVKFIATHGGTFDKAVRYINKLILGKDGKGILNEIARILPGGEYLSRALQWAGKAIENGDYKKLQPYIMKWLHGLNPEIPLDPNDYKVKQLKTDLPTPSKTLNDEKEDEEEEEENEEEEEDDSIEIKKPPQLIAKPPQLIAKPPQLIAKPPLKIATNPIVKNNFTISKPPENNQTNTVPLHSMSTKDAAKSVFSSL